MKGKTNISYPTIQGDSTGLQSRVQIKTKGAILSRGIRDKLKNM